MEDICLRSMRCPVYRRLEANSGLDKGLGKSSGDAKGKSIRVIPEMQNTDALEDGGSASSSVEAPVMGVEPRGRHGYMGILVNWETRRNYRISPERGYFARKQLYRHEEPCDGRLSSTVP